MGKKTDDGYQQSPKDVLNAIARMGAAFDWITPLATIWGGYNTVDMDETMDHAGCKAMVKDLQRQGVKAKVDFTGDGWRVISAR